MSSSLLLKPVHTIHVFTAVNTGLILDATWQHQAVKFDFTAIIFSSCGFFFPSIYLIFPRLFSAVADWSLPYTSTHYVALVRTYRCRSETCCTRPAKNTGRKQSPKIRHMRSIAQICRAMSSQRRHVSTIEKKLLNSNIPPHVLTIW